MFNEFSPSNNQPLTIIKNIFGNVSIERANEVLLAKEGNNLYENDTVDTHEGCLYIQLANGEIFEIPTGLKFSITEQLINLITINKELGLHAINVLGMAHKYSEEKQDGRRIYYMAALIVLLLLVSMTATTVYMKAEFHEGSVTAGYATSPIIFDSFFIMNFIGGIFDRIDNEMQLPTSFQEDLNNIQMIENLPGTLSGLSIEDVDTVAENIIGTYLEVESTEKINDSSELISTLSTVEQDSPSTPTNPEGVTFARENNEPIIFNDPIFFALQTSDSNLSESDFIDINSLIGTDQLFNVLGYELVLLGEEGVYSGVNDALTSAPIYLYSNVGTDNGSVEIVGRLNDEAGAQAFSLSIINESQLTLTQQRAVMHNGVAATPGSGNEQNKAVTIDDLIQVQ